MIRVIVSIMCGCVASGNACGQGIDLVESRLRRGYQNALNENLTIHARWTVFAHKLPIPHSDAAKRVGGLRFRDPLDNAPVEAVRLCRAWSTGGDRVRIENTTPFVLGGPEELKWMVWATDGKIHVNAATLTSRRADITPERPLDPKIDDLFNDLEAQCLGVIVQRLVIWLRADGTTINNTDPDVCLLTTSGGPVRVEWVPGTDMLRSVRYRLKAAPKDLAVEYQYQTSSFDGVFPSHHPTSSRVNLLDPDETLGAGAWVIKFDVVELQDTQDATRYTWQSVAASARRTDTNEVIRSTGEVDPAKTFATRTQQTFEPLKHTDDFPQDGGLPKAIDKTPAWSRWLLVGGITSIVLAVGLGLRRRAGA